MPNPTILKEKKVFTLQEAKRLIPGVHKITHHAIHKIDHLAKRLELLHEDDPEFHKIGAQIDKLLHQWSDKVYQMGVESKVLWSVEFDNGHGYYSWTYPEEDVEYFYEYDKDFLDRKLIC